MVAALALLSSVVLGVAPTRGRAVVAFQPPGTEIAGDVDCGSVFSSTRWTHDDGCEGPLLTRMGLVTLGALVGVVATGAALALRALDRRNRA